MNNAIADRRLPISVLNLCQQCLHQYRPKYRAFATSITRAADTPSPLGVLGRAGSDKDQENLALLTMFGTRSNAVKVTDDMDFGRGRISQQNQPAHHFHIYSTKHNTHITLTNPNRDSLISLSAGNIGFRKAARGTYDAAYQLAAYVLGRIYEEGLLQKIKKLDVVLRGFGVGREAVTKALLGSEGRLIRDKITEVSDATRLKFGGTRSKKPRRLG